MEDRLAIRAHILDRESELLPLAVRATKALHPLLADDAHEMSFGPAQIHPSDVSIEVEPLAWPLLSEVTKCLSVRDLLPADLSPADQQAIAQHAAWRWFESLSHPRLAYLAMNDLVQKQVQCLQDHADQPPLTIWSAHDSTLIGLMCAYRLLQPSEWPEYASYLILELLEITRPGQAAELGVRFSLNGETLASKWEDDGVEYPIIPLSVLADKAKFTGVEAALS